MEIDIVTCVWVQMWRELRVLPDRSSGLFEDTFTLAVTYDVVFLSRDCLTLKLTTVYDESI